MIKVVLSVLDWMGEFCYVKPVARVERLNINGISALTVGSLSSGLILDVVMLVEYCSSGLGSYRIGMEL